MKLVVVIALLVALSHQQCAKGCLRCSSANVCLICDVTNSYYAFNNTCATSNLTNCALLSQGGACVACSSGYYLDGATSKCVTVPTNNTVANCAAYSGSIACTGCASGYYISSGACVLANTTVANCDYYSANGVCSSCKSGFIFSYNNSLCVALTAASNCNQYTYAGCSSCNSGYFLNRNLFYLAYASSATGADWVIPFTGSGVHVPLSVCQAVTVTNCAVLLNYNTCQTCSSGYYLSAGQCLANPSPLIPNCATYSSLVTCTNCVANYFLNSGACSPIIAIPYCVTYSTVLSPTTCIACNSTSFVNNNACAVRTNTNIANCASYTANADTCASCNTGFRLTSNGLLCLAVIANCATYATWSVGQTAFTCSVCADTYALTNTNGATTCPSGTIANCAQYSSSSTCTSCANGYYLSSNACVQHVSIPNCAVYSQSTANTCVTCNNGNYLISYQKTCVAIATLITNCVRYQDSGDNCVQCAAGYYLNSNACTAIPSGNNCVTMTTSGCTSCSTGYVINPALTSPTCIAELDYISANCDSLMTGNWVELANTSNHCDVCKVNSIPYKPAPSEAICVKQTDYTNFFGPTTWIVSNCVRYGLLLPETSGKIACQECGGTDFLLNYPQANGNLRSCGACDVSAGANIITHDDLAGSVNICWDITFAGFGLTSPNYLTRIARTTTRSGTITDFQTLSTVSSRLLMGNIANQFAIEAPSASTTTPLTSSTDFYQGFLPLATEKIRPSIFFWRGLLLGSTLADISTAPSPNWTTNCVLAYSMPGSGSISSARAGGNTVDYWSPISSATNHCLKCAPGFDMSFAPTNTGLTSGFKPYPMCVANSANCASTTVFFGGLPTYLNNLISCHSCPANSSPLVAFEYSAFASNSIRENKFQNFRILVDVATSGVVSACAATPTTVIKDDTTTAAALTNCGVFGNLVPLTDSSTKVTGTARNYCLACATGYVPTYKATAAVGGGSADPFTPYFAVTACTASLNCDSGVTNTNKPFNACGKCSVASVSASPPVYYAYTDHTFANCLPSWTNNCFILDGTSLSSSTGNRCKVCASGYFLNQDGYCDTLTVPNMSTGATFTPSYYHAKLIAQGDTTDNWDAIHVRIYYGLSYWASQYGVSACATNYVRAAPVYNAPLLCVVSSYLSNNVARPTDSNLRKFVADCTKYESPTANVIPATSPLYNCVACVSGKIPTENGQSCVTAVTNCMFAKTSDPTKCQICNNGWWNVNDVCSQQTIPNCAVLQNDQVTTVATLQCNTCNPGYYVNNQKTCTFGNVANCKSYSGGNGNGGNIANNCSECLSGFILISIASSTTYCYPIPTTVDCSLVDDSSSSPQGLKQGAYTCSSCNYQAAAPKKAVLWSAQTTTTLAQGACWPLYAILNCQTYDQSSSTLSSNTFKCTQCNSGFYLTNGGWNCTTRTVQPSNCASYVSNQDKCASCASGYFLNTAMTACVAFPIGVTNCVLFNTPTNCTQCASGYFVSSGNCVASTTTVTNCLIYSANNTCSACNAGYYLASSSSCVSATATNCLTYASATACATCAFGYALTTSNSITSCNQITVANCAILSSSNQNNCGVCNTGYYLNTAGVCTAVTTTITNCLYYSAVDKCANCTAGYTLAADQTTCSNTYSNVVDANCANSFMLNSAACARCSYGYVWGSSGCTQCAAYSSGCAICDSANTTNCLLCQPAYYMNQNATCVANPVPVNNTNTTTNTTPVTPSGVDRLTFWTLTVALFVTLFGMN